MTDSSAVKIPRYELFRRDGRQMGRLLEDYTYKTPVVGFGKTLNLDSFGCRLSVCGALTIFAGSEWDFGTGAVDTPAMVYGSLAHDALCHMTNHRLLPWSVRMQADRFLWSCLSAAGATTSRWWRVPGVMIYSQAVARWKDVK